MKQTRQEKYKLEDKKLTFNKELAAAINSRFADAQTARASNFQHFDVGLDQVLVDCHYARRGILSPDEKEVADELAHVGLAFGKQKSVTAANVFNDLVRNSIDQPLLEPTPVPDLPDDIKESILADLKQELLENKFSGDLRELASSLKLQAYGTTMERAKSAAVKAEIALRDVLAESDIRNVMQELLDDFCAMPYCVAKSPSYRFIDTPYWNKDEIAVKREIKPTVERISPFNFWILNGTTPQNAEACFEIASVQDAALKEMKGKKGWISESIDAALSTEAPRHPMANSIRWNHENKEQIADFRHTGTDTRELLWAHCRVNGSDLIKLDVDKYGGKAIDAEKVYEVCVGVVNFYIVHLTTMAANSPSVRPYQVASFEPINGSWAGIGILQRVAKAERIARSFTFSAIRNAAYSAKPTGEIDYTRLKEFYPNQEDLQGFMAGHLYLSTPDRTGAAGGRGAVNFFDVPNNTQQLLNGVTFFLEILESLAGVGKLTVGNMQGLATLGRSHRGISLVMGAESKLVRAALDNFDKLMLEPQLKAMYLHMLQNNKDAQIKGDASIIARSTMGYLNRETQAASRQESLNSAVGLAAQGLVDKELLTMLVENVLQDQGIDIKAYKARQAQTAALQGQSPADIAAAGVSQQPPPALPGSTGITNEQGNTIPGTLG